MSNSRKFDFIVAVDSHWGISKDGFIPWTNTPAGRDDMAWFKRKTKGKAVIMGRKTWESLQSNPLPDRVNVVISSAYSDLSITGALTNSPTVYVSSFTKALDWCFEAISVGTYGLKKCMVIGGAAIYKQACLSPYLDTGFVTVIDGDYHCDKFFPKEYVCDRQYYNMMSLKGLRVYQFTNFAEVNYRELVKRLIYAPVRPNRTGIAARGLFHEVLKFPLYENGRDRVLPLLTLKKMPFDKIYHELIWFLRGSTDTSYLQKNNVKIWDGNSTREFLDSRGLTDYVPGEVGPIYGYQWRNWNAPYFSAGFQPRFEDNDDHSDYTDHLGHNNDKYPLAKYPLAHPLANGIDQIANVIKTIKNDPWNRAMIVSAWNVEQLSQMALPPCHNYFQFYVTTDENGRPQFLNCFVNMRSADVGLGVPFNIASYALLVHMISYITNILPGTLSINMVDCHLYVDQIDKMQELLKRTPRRFPTLEFSPAIKDLDNLSIDDFAYKSTIDDFIICSYEPHPRINLQMAV